MKIIRKSSPTVLSPRVPPCTHWIILILAIAALVGPYAPRAHANLMTGDNISVFFSQPNNSTPYSGFCVNNPVGCFSSLNFTVGPGIETNFACCGGGSLAASIDFSANSLVITWLNGIAGNYGGTFQGFVFTDATNAFGPIGTVTGLSPSLVSDAGQKLYVNLGPGSTGFGFNRGDQIAVTFGNNTAPEPSTLVLFAAAVLSLGIFRRTRCRL